MEHLNDEFRNWIEWSEWHSGAPEWAPYIWPMYKKKWPINNKKKFLGAGAPERRPRLGAAAARAGADVAPRDEPGEDLSAEASRIIMICH